MTAAMVENMDPEGRMLEQVDVDVEAVKNPKSLT